MNRHKYLLPGLIFSLLFAGVGIYYLLNASAATTFGRTYTDNRMPWVLYPHNLEDANSFVPREFTGGQTFTVPFITGLNATKTPTQQYVYIFNYDASLIQVTKVSCQFSSGCYKSSATGESDFNWPAPIRHNTNIAVCVNASKGIHRAVPVFSVAFKAKKDFQTYALFAVMVGPAASTCSSNPTASDLRVNTSGFTAALEYDCRPICYQGSAPGSPSYTGFGGSGGNTTTGGGGAGDKGTGKKGTSSAGGSSTPSKTGNTAKNTSNTKAAGGSTKQTDKKGSAPSSTSQGGKDTPNKLEPSPFYDGKQYQPGSATDKGVGGAIRKTGRGLLKIAPYIAGVILLFGLLFLWWRRRQFVKHRI